MTKLPLLIEYLQSFMPIESQPLFTLYRLYALYLSPQTSPSDHAKAVQAVALAYRGAEKLLPPGHPTRGVILAQWGKMLAMELEGHVSKQEVLRRLMEAVVVLRKAYTACEEGFGPGGGLVGKEVEGLIRGCEGEIGLIRAHSM